MSIITRRPLNSPHIAAAGSLTTPSNPSSTPLSISPYLLFTTPELAARDELMIPVQLRSHGKQARVSTAVVYCEANFGAIDGKTANGLVRHSEKYKILSVIDSEKAGLDAGMVLDNAPNAIPICRDLADSLAQAGSLPDYFIFGMAPSSGMLSTLERGIVLEAINLGMNIVNGLHEFLNDDPLFVAASKENNVEIIDVRKPRAKKDLRIFSGRIAEVTCPRIAVLGTDCAIGKRTTATILASTLRERGMNVVMIGTGQTGLIQGARYGIALDAVPSQFCAGELEALIVEAFESENPDVIIIEGQGALSHPAFSTTSFILRGSCPNGVILQHAPGRTHRCDFEQMVMPTPATEINLIQTFADTQVIGLTINHENMTDAEVSTAIASYEDELGIPVTDALTRSPEHLVQMVLSAFPEFEKKLTACAL
ncbi:hypothetical protein PBPRB1849 [Photobacterium profundum SS9]|uniref:EBNA-1 nuclear protein n=2 Tax=Photobacterium profundum TaxID=74109 RepID=Q6LG81_PHOPR|nr:hypothetical protein PBPRB1849 [Photobacterium profundum SS9]